MASSFHRSLLVIPVGLSAMNMLIVGPNTSKIMFKRHQLEDKGETDSPQYTSLKKRFAMLHGISSLLNLIIICFAAYHGVKLAQMFEVDMVQS